MLCNRGRFILVVMSITFYYLWDGNTFQIGYPSKAFSFFLSFWPVIVIIIIIRPFSTVLSILFISSSLFCCRLIQLYSVRRNCIFHFCLIFFGTVIFFSVALFSCVFFKRLSHKHETVCNIDEKIQKLCSRRWNEKKENTQNVNFVVQNSRKSNS